MEYFDTNKLLRTAHFNDFTEIKSLTSTLFCSLAPELKHLFSVFLEVFECYWKFHIELLQSQAKIALDLTGFLI